MYAIQAKPVTTAVYLYGVILNTTLDFMHYVTIVIDYKTLMCYI